MNAGAMMTPGIWVDFGGGRRLLVPPLSLGSLELLQDRIDEMPTLQITDRRAVATVIDATHAALRRNYPDVTRDEVGELIDIGNMAEVYGCVLDYSGFKRQASEAGNAPAVSAQIGAASSPSSAPTPDGPGPTSESTLTSPPLTP